MDHVTMIGNLADVFASGIGAWLLACGVTGEMRRRDEWNLAAIRIGVVLLALALAN